jgi:hypothetical protein
VEDVDIELTWDPPWNPRADVGRRQDHLGHRLVRNPQHDLAELLAGSSRSCAAAASASGKDWSIDRLAPPGRDEVVARASKSSCVPIVEP